MSIFGTLFGAFFGDAVGNPRRRSGPSACTRMYNAKTSYEKHKKRRNEKVQEAGSIKTRREKARINIEQKAMNKYKAEYNKYKAACADEEQRTVVHGQRVQYEEGMKRKMKAAREDLENSVPRTPESEELHRNMKEKLKVYRAAKEYYESLGARGRGGKAKNAKESLSEAKESYKTAKQAYRSTRDNELAAAAPSAPSRFTSGGSYTSSPSQSFTPSSTASSETKSKRRSRRKTRRSGRRQTRRTRRRSRR